ncbi:MAG: hypothetical protein AAF211_31995 [Myxococcota bacterium]
MAANPPAGLRAWSGIVLGGLALVVAAAGWVSARETSAQLTRLEDRIASIEQTQTTRRAIVGAAGEARKKRLQRRAEAKARRAKAPVRERPSPEVRQQKLRKEVTAHVEAFATERGLDAETVEEVLVELETRNDAVRAVFQDLATGAVSTDQAREEVQWVRDDSADALRTLLGDELHDALEEHLAERSPRRRRAAMNRPGPEGAAD